MPSEVYALWWRGSSYALPSFQDLESFASVNDAENEFRNRVHHPYSAVDEDSTVMDIFLSDPREVSDPYPDYRISFENGKVVWCCG